MVYKYFYKIILAFFLCINIAISSDDKSENLGIYQDQMQESLNNIEKYLNDLTTFYAAFMQEDQNSTIATGRFYLSRPGKLRWEYDEPEKIIIVAKNKLLSYYNVDLDEISHIGIDDSLASFLIRDKISFDDENIKIIAFKEFIENEEEYILVTVEPSDEDKANLGSLTLIFTKENIELVQMHILDAADNITKVGFEVISKNVNLKDELFKLPRKEQKDYRKRRK